VLIVEDSPSTRRFFVSVLERAGLEVAEAADGVAALEAARVAPPDAILLDLILPDLSAEDLVGRLRELPATTATPIIAMTGWQRVQDDAAPLPPGVDALLVKPVDGERLLSVLRAHLPPSTVACLPAGQEARHVVYLEDDPVRRRLGGLHLTCAGFRVSAAATVAAALALATSDPPDLVLADALVPCADGFDLCLALRRDARTERVPVVLVLPLSPNEVDRRDARRVGATAVIARGVGFEGHVAAARSFASGGREEAPAPEVSAISAEERERRLLRHLQRQVTLSAGLAQRCAQQGVQLVMLDLVAEALSKTADLGQVLRELLTRSLAASGVSRGALFRTGREPGLTLEHVVGFPQRDLQQLADAYGHLPLLEQVVRDEVARVIVGGADPSTDDLLARAGVVSIMLVPLVGGGLRLGVLLLASDMADMTRQDLLSFGRALGAYLGQAVALAAAFTRLGEAERVNEFLSVLAHELRAPLAPILLAVELMRLHEGSPALVARYRETVNRQVGHLARMVDDLVDTSRLTHGKVELSLEPLDLGALVSEAVEDRRPIFESLGQSLSLTGPTAPVVVRGDRTRLMQVLGNLLTNATKFTPAGGRVTVRVEARERDAIVSIRDTGVGIAPEVLSRLFQPFMQGAQALDRTQGGLGLGLAVAKGLVELHGGAVAATSEGEGRGAELTVVLPLAAPDATEAGRPVSGRLMRANAARLRVLIVEDNLDGAALLQELLELPGYEVHITYTGPDGVETARRVAPDVVICDIGLPGLDGFGVARALRAERGTGVYLVAVSGYGDPERVARMKAAGFDEQLVKPVQADTLLRLVAARAASIRTPRGDVGVAS
jgi:signal transduction histidine kinase/FixJ family two-component response regulator